MDLTHWRAQANGAGGRDGGARGEEGRAAVPAAQLSRVVRRRHAAAVGLCGALDRDLAHGLRALGLGDHGGVVLHAARHCERGYPGGGRHLHRPSRPSAPHLGAGGHLRPAVADDGRAFCLRPADLRAVPAALSGIERRVWPARRHDQRRAHHRGGARTLCRGRKPQPRTRRCGAHGWLSLRRVPVRPVACGALLRERAL